MNKKLMGLFVGLVFSLSLSTAHAIVSTYHVQGVFADGGMLTGDFTYDSSLAFPFILITTTLGSDQSGDTYTDWANGWTGVCVDEPICSDLAVLRFDMDGANGGYLDLSFVDPLEGQIGVKTLLAVDGASYEMDSAGDVRNLIYGEVLILPIPATVWLFGSGLVGLIGVARRKVQA